MSRTLVSVYVCYILYFMYGIANDAPNRAVADPGFDMGGASTLSEGVLKNHWKCWRWKCKFLHVFALFVLICWFNMNRVRKQRGN